MAEEVDHKFLDFVVKGLVDNPKDVKIERTIDEMGVLLTLNINPADMGQIIG
ncbi:KH domain-containing protein, partial [bacterium]|nr:KH domain-containing protein [bacterium]